LAFGKESRKPNMMIPANFVLTGVSLQLRIVRTITAF